MVIKNVDYGPDRQPRFLWSFMLGGKLVNLTSTPVTMPGECFSNSRKYRRSLDRRDACCASLLSTSFCFSRPRCHRNSSLQLRPLMEDVVDHIIHLSNTRGGGGPSALLMGSVKVGELPGESGLLHPRYRSRATLIPSPLNERSRIS